MKTHKIAHRTMAIGALTVSAIGVAALSAAHASVGPDDQVTATSQAGVTFTVNAYPGGGGGNCDEFMCGTNHNQVLL
jgi:hypothetical protein